MNPTRALEFDDRWFSLHANRAPDKMGRIGGFRVFDLVLGGNVQLDCLERCLPRASVTVEAPCW